MNRIGIFAGVFDPIHIGHTRFMARAVKEHGLDKIYLLIEKEPKYKTCLAAYDHRVKMARLALEDIPGAEVYEPKSKFFPISSTLPEIRANNPNARLFLLLGDDVAKHIDKWPDSKELLSGVELIVANRDQDDKYSKVSSLKVRGGIKQGSSDPGLDRAVLKYCLDNKLYN